MLAALSFKLFGSLLSLDEFSLIVSESVEVWKSESWEGVARLFLESIARRVAYSLLGFQFIRNLIDLFHQMDLMPILDFSLKLV